MQPLNVNLHILQQKRITLNAIEQTYVCIKIPIETLLERLRIIVTGNCVLYLL